MPSKIVLPVTYCITPVAIETSGVIGPKVFPKGDGQES